MFRRALFVLLALICNAFPGISCAAGFPQHPIRIIVSFTPGDGPDVMARLIGAKISTTLGQSVVIENKPGASGQIAMTDLARSEADGYTIGVGLVTNIALAPHAYKTLPYDPLKDLLPVAMIGVNYLALVTASDSKFTSTADLIKWAKEHPGKLNVGTTSIGGLPHMSIELLAFKEGFKFVNIAYKGNGPIISDLLGGRLDAGFSSYTSLAPLIDSGKLRLLGISSPETDPLLPKLPLMSAGSPGYGSLGWFGFFAPAGVPPEVIKTLNASINDAMQTADVKKSMQQLGMSPWPMSPQAFGELVQNDFIKFKKLVKDISYTPE